MILDLFNDTVVQWEELALSKIILLSISTSTIAKVDFPYSDKNTKNQSYAAR